MFIFQSEYSIIKMINFMNTLPQKEQLYYRRLMHIVGLNDSTKQKRKDALELNNEEMFDFCRFNDRAQFNSTIQARISSYNQAETGNTCLHIAGEYGNIKMMKYIITNKLIDTRSLNKNKDSPLFYTLKHSAHENFEKSVLLLAST